MLAHGLNYNTSDIHGALFSFPSPFRATTTTTFSSVPPTRIHRGLGSTCFFPALVPLRFPALLFVKNRSGARDLVGWPGINAASNSVNEATSKLRRRSGRLNAGPRHPFSARRVSSRESESSPPQKGCRLPPSSPSRRKRTGMPRLAGKLACSELFRVEAARGIMNPVSRVFRLGSSFKPKSSFPRTSRKVAVACERLTDELLSAARRAFSTLLFRSTSNPDGVKFRTNRWLEKRVTRSVAGRITLSFEENGEGSNALCLTNPFGNLRGPTRTVP